MTNPAGPKEPQSHCGCHHSSALICILRARRAAVHGGVQSTGQLYMGAATRAETWLAAHNAKGKPGALQIEALMVALHVETVDFTAGSLVHCQHGAEHHHHKVDSKASLNMDDLFTYALARET